MSAEDEEIKSLDEEAAPKFVNLVASDGVVPVRADWLAAHSGFYQTAASLEEDGLTEFPLKDYPVRVITLFVEYIAIHQGKVVEEEEYPKMPLTSKNLSEAATRNGNTIRSEDAELMERVFLRSTQDGEENLGYFTMEDLLLFANYVDCRSLVHLCTARIAAAIKCKPASEAPGILEKFVSVAPASVDSSSSSMDQDAEDAEDAEEAEEPEGAEEESA